MVYAASATLSCLILITNLIFGKKYFLHSLFLSIISFIFIGQENGNLDLLASNRFLGTPIVYFPVMMSCVGLSFHCAHKNGFKSLLKLLRSPADKYVLLFLIWFSIVGFYQGGVVSGLPYMAGYLFLWYTFRLERTLFSEELSDKEFKILKFGILLSLIGFIISLYLNSQDPYFVPIRFLNRNCGVMILLSFLVINYAWIENANWKRSLSWFSFGVTFSLIYLTQSRSGLLACIVFIGLMLWRNKRTFTVLLSLFLSLVVFLLTTFIFHKTVIRKNIEAESTLARFGSIAKQTRMTIEGKPVEKIEVSTHERIVHLKDAFKVINEKWFMGTGLGFKNYFRFVKLDIERTPHNIFISYLAQMGIIGLLIFIMIHFQLFSNAISTPTAYPFVAFISAVVVHLLFNEYYLQPYLWAVLGIIPSLPWKNPSLC